MTFNPTNQTKLNTHIRIIEDVLKNILGKIAKIFW